MIRSIYFLLSFFIVIIARAQTPLYSEKFADSLNHLLQQKITDSTRARIYFQLSAYWILQDTAKSQAFISAGKKVITNNPYIAGIGDASDGYYYYYTGNLKKSEAAYAKVEERLSPFRNKEALFIRSNAWSNRAKILQREDDDKGYVAIMLNKAIPLAIQSGDSGLLASHYVGLGVAFMNLNQNTKAEQYFDKAIAILNKTLSNRLVAAYNRAGENYMLLKKWDKVKEMLSANKKILANYPNSEYYAGYYMIEGMYFHELKQYIQAIVSFDNGINKANGPNKNSVISELRFYKVQSLLALQRYSAAKRVLQELTADEEVMSFDQSRQEVYQHLATVYAGLHQADSAFYYQKQYSIISDSLHESKFRNDINELEAKYQSSENQKQIEALKAEKIQAKLAASRNKIFYWLLGISCVLLLVIALSSYSYIRNNKKLSLQKEINHQQELKKLEQQQQLNITKSILEGEERERERVAKDLHDGLGGMLAGIKINFSGWAAANVTPDQSPTVNKIIKQMDSSVGELRRVARNLMPESLLQLGLEAGLKDLCEFYMKDGVHIEFQSFGISSTIPQYLQIHIYRIVQELLSNVIKHASATNIVLQCSQAADIFFITFEDNGIGFDLNALNGQKGLGIRNIKSRVGYLAGKIEIISTPGDGTAIHIELKVH